MDITTKIETSEAFKNACKSLVKRGKRLNMDCGDLVAYCYLQVMNHGNASPFSELRAIVTSMGSRPTGFNRKSLDHFVTEYTPFGVVDSAYKKQQDKNAKPLPAEHVRFWEYAKETEEKSPEDRLLRALTAAYSLQFKSNISMESFETIAQEAKAIAAAKTASSTKKAA